MREDDWLGETVSYLTAKGSGDIDLLDRWIGEEGSERGFDRDIPYLLGSCSTIEVGMSSTHALICILSSKGNSFELGSLFQNLV